MRGRRRKGPSRRAGVVWAEEGSGPVDPEGSWGKKETPGAKSDFPKESRRPRGGGGKVNKLGPGTAGPVDLRDGM